MRNNRDRKEPLYRKVNTRTRNVRHGGAEYRWDRNSKAKKSDTRNHGSMNATANNGLDYTPLFRFLLSKVGKDWGEVYSEAKSRLPSDEPIFWLVAKSKELGRPMVCLGESSYFSGLYINENDVLSIVNPDINIGELLPYCHCCTHTFNGKRFTKKFDPEISSLQIYMRMNEITGWEP